MQRYLLIFLVLVIATPNNLRGQMTFGFTMPPGVDKVEIPFREANNLIVIPVVLNHFLKLNFILDTGVETPILTEMSYANLIGVKYIREVVVTGVGVNDSIRAFVGNQVNIKLPGNIIGHNLNLLVLQEDYLKLSEKMGMDVHGIIGYDIFKAFVVEIDYDQKVIILHRPDKFRPRKKLSSMPLAIINSKPYITTSLNQDKLSDTVKLMIDTGASHAVLLDVDQTLLTFPEKTVNARLGTGLGGAIPGKLGRIDSFHIMQYEFNDIIVSMPESDVYGQAIKRGSRQGTLGGDVLSRLTPIFDYQKQKIYLGKGIKYRSRFEFDMSGLSLAVTGIFLDSILIEHVRENSPAEDVGILEGDILLTVNGFDSRQLSFSQIQSILRKKPNLKIRLKILRQGEKIKRTIRLKRAI